MSVLVSVAIAGIAAFSGFWLVSQFGNSSGPSLPETGAPELEVPTADVDPADVEPTDEADELEEEGSVDEKPDKVPKKEKPEEQPEVVEPSDVVDTANAQLPLVLNDTGNPANDRPGDLDRSVVIPGFSPGDSADQIRRRLGAPTHDSTVDGVYTSVYELAPNRVRLAYTYEQGATQVSQSEATFSPGTDFLKMRTAVSGMVNGASADVVDGLRAVRAGERDRYEFTRRGLSGVIERNAYGYVHVYVR